MTRSELIAQCERYTRPRIKVPFDLPGRGKIWCDTYKGTFLALLMREYDADEETGLTVEWARDHGIIYIRAVGEDL